MNEAGDLRRFVRCEPMTYPRYQPTNCSGSGGPHIPFRLVRWWRRCGQAELVAPRGASPNWKRNWRSTGGYENCSRNLCSWHEPITTTPSNSEHSRMAVRRRPKVPRLRWPSLACRTIATERQVVQARWRRGDATSGTAWAKGGEVPPDLGHLGAPMTTGRESMSVLLPFVYAIWPRSRPIPARFWIVNGRRRRSAVRRQPLTSTSVAQPVVGVVAARGRRSGPNRRTMRASRNRRHPSREVPATPALGS